MSDITLKTEREKALELVESIKIVLEQQVEEIQRLSDRNTRLEEALSDRTQSYQKVLESQARAEKLLEDYKKAVADRFRYDMQAILSDTPENASRMRIRELETRIRELEERAGEHCPDCRTAHLPNGSIR